MYIHGHGVGGFLLIQQSPTGIYSVTYFKHGFFFSLINRVDAFQISFSAETLYLIMFIFIFILDFIVW